MINDFSLYSEATLSLRDEFKLTRSAATCPAFKVGVKKRRSGSTLSKPGPSGRGVEGLTCGI